LAVRERAALVVGDERGCAAPELRGNLIGRSDPAPSLPNSRLPT